MSANKGGEWARKCEFVHIVWLSFVLWTMPIQGGVISVALKYIAVYTLNEVKQDCYEV